MLNETQTGFQHKGSIASPNAIQISLLVDPLSHLFQALPIHLTVFVGGRVGGTPRTHPRTDGTPRSVPRTKDTIIRFNE